MIGDMNVLYLAPLIPDISGSGGKRAVYNHLENLLQQGIRIKLLLVDVEGTELGCPQVFNTFSPTVFPRALPRMGRGVWAKCLALMQLFWGRLPRSSAVVASKQAKEEFSRLVASGDFDLIVVEHLNAYAIVEGVSFSQPLIYIAQNIESDVLKDQCQMAKSWSMERLIYKLEHLKSVRFEHQLIEKAQKIILISSGDRDSIFLQNVQEKVSVWPELPSIKEKSWSFSATRNMLFVGSAKYFPNREAIIWLVEKLMPEIRRLNSTITLTIAGTTRDELNLSATSGVIYKGFVSSEELESLHLKSDLFICPVIYGSGIKIKVLEASSFGIPIIATTESFAGIEYLTGASIGLSRDTAVDAQNIINNLSDTEKLNAISRNSILALIQAHKNRPFLAGNFETWIRAC